MNKTLEINNYDISNVQMKDKSFLDHKAYPIHLACTEIWDALRVPPLPPILNYWNIFKDTSPIIWQTVPRWFNQICPCDSWKAFLKRVYVYFCVQPKVPTAAPFLFGPGVVVWKKIEYTLYGDACIRLIVP